MKSISEAWKMVALSARVLGKRPFLMGYVLLAALASGLLVAALGAPVAVHAFRRDAQWLEPYASIPDTAPHGKSRISLMKPHWEVVAPVGAAGYFAGTFAVIFFNVAFLLSVKRILNGQEITFRGGLALAWERRGAVLKWALFSASVGLLFSLLKNKADNWLTRRFIGFLELGWNLAIFLAVPVVAAEGCGPVEALKRSASLFKKNWGQTLAGDISVGALQALVWVLAGVIPGALLFYFGIINTGAAWQLAVGGAAWVLVSLALLALLGESVLMVFRMVLYVFAVEGVVPDEYKDQDSSWFVAQRG